MDTSATASRHGRSSWDDYAGSSLYWAYELGAPTDLFYELSEVFRIAYPSNNQNDKIRHSACKCCTNERAQQESVLLVQLEELTDSLKGCWENGDIDEDEFYRLFNELSNSTIRLHYTAYEKYRKPGNYLSAIRRGIGKIMAMDQMLRRQDREGVISYLTRLRDGLQRRSPAGSPPDLGLLFILTRYVSEILLGLLSKIQDRQEVNASNAVFTTEFAVSFSNTFSSVIRERHLAWGGDVSKWEAGRSAFRAIIFLSCELDKIKHNAIFEALTDNSISRELKFYAVHYLAALQKKEAPFKLSAGERLLFSYSVGYVATTNRSTRTYQSTSKTEGGEYHSNTVHWGHGVSNTQGTLSPRTRRTNSLTETSSHRAWADEKPSDLMITSRQLWFSTHDKTVGSTINLSKINSMTPSEEGLHFIRGTRSTPEQFVQAQAFAYWGTEPDPFLAKTAELAWRQGQEIEERANELIAEYEAEDGNNIGESNLNSAAIENREVASEKHEVASESKYCDTCGGSININAEICPKCSFLQILVQDVASARYLSPENINTSPKSFVAALIFVVLLGWLGVHRFYVGKPVTGIIIILTLGGFFPIWPLIDLILIATGNFKDSNGMKIKP
ncbi:MAG: TM2 domain-containing protein [Chloroflexi bacterium]|nr:TM2 domain-containing protein [Chloroflexota bacterium]MDA1282587.1 TM2 domain-containing protein [Chloroflexota bacterium]